MAIEVSAQLKIYFNSRKTNRHFKTDNKDNDIFINMHYYCNKQEIIHYYGTIWLTDEDLYLQTDIHTDRQTDIQTDRQTDTHKTNIYFSSNKLKSQMKI